MRKLTTEEFIEKAKVVHKGNKYDYSKVEYVNNRTKITIICKIHGDFEQQPNNHLIGCDCPKCKGKNQTTEDFIIKARQVHADKYEYSKANYTSSSAKITIACKEHGEFEQTPNDHLKGHGCPKCANCKKLTTEEFIYRANLIHGDKYDYLQVNYISNNTKVIITCSMHGEFEQTPINHLSGYGCSSCAKTGFDTSKPAYLYYLKITTEDNQTLYKIGITNRTVNERFNLTDLNKIEIVKQKLYENGAEALEWETKLKRLYKQYQYIGHDILSSGNTELFTEDIMSIYYIDNNLT